MLGYKRRVSTKKGLAAALGDIRASEDPADRNAYARDLWPRQLIDVRRGSGPAGPQLVVWPKSTDDVVEVLRRARDEGASVVPYGAGSGVCGGIAPDDKTVVLDLKQLAGRRLLREAPALEVGPGAMGITLEEDLQRQGFTIGHFPSSILCSTVGGWIAARGAGQCSGLYGKIEDMVAELDCVLGSGEVVRLKRRTEGLDLTPLFVGSEGTLGVITRSVLRLHPAPAARGFAAFSFKDIESGWEAMRQLFQAGLRPAVSRLYDPIDSFILKRGAVKRPKKKTATAAASSKGVRRTGQALRSLLSRPRLLNGLIEAAEGNLLGGSTLIVVFEGGSEETADDVRRASALCEAAGGVSLGEGPARRWLEHRYSVSYRQAPVFRMGAFSDTMEVSAPWSRLGALYDGVREALGGHVLVMAHLSHAYPDGCSIYFTFSGTADSDEAALQKYDRAWRAALAAAVAAGGSLSHHHGVGRSKAPRLGPELGLGVELVHGLRAACDPASMLNPGNLVPRESTAEDRKQAEQLGTRQPGIDAHSLLVTVQAGDTLQQVEDQLQRDGLTLGLSSGNHAGLSVKEWVGRGMPGAPDRWDDPVAQMLAGFVARLSGDRRLVVRPAPRRAVGPDLSSLFVGTGERVGSLEAATLRVQREGTTVRQLPFEWERNPPVEAGEQALLDKICAAIG